MGTAVLIKLGDTVQGPRCDVKESSLSGGLNWLLRSAEEAYSAALVRSFLASHYTSGISQRLRTYHPAWFTYILFCFKQPIGTRQYYRTQLLRLLLDIMFYDALPLNMHTIYFK